MFLDAVKLSLCAAAAFASAAFVCWAALRVSYPAKLQAREQSLLATARRSVIDRLSVPSWAVVSLILYSIPYAVIVASLLLSHRSTEIADRIFSEAKPFALFVAYPLISGGIWGHHLYFKQRQAKFEPSARKNRQS